MIFRAENEDNPKIKKMAVNRFLNCGYSCHLYLSNI